MPDTRAADRAQEAAERTRDRLPYPATLPPTPESACRSCGRPILGTRAGYAEFCPTCLAAGAEGEPDAPVPEYAYSTGRAALASWARLHQRACGCPAVIPERDRVQGGAGSRRGEWLAQAAVVEGVVETALVGEDGEPDRAAIGALAVWAVGCLSPARTRDDEPGSWTWKELGAALGCNEDRARQRLGALCARVYGALRERGVIAPRETETKEADVRYRDGDEWVYQWDGVVDWLESRGLRVAIRTAQRWRREKGLPVVTDGPVRARVAALDEWLAGQGSLAEGEAA